MELDDFKKEWNQYDEKLDKALKVNEKLLQELNLDRAKSELTQPFYYALFGAGISFVIVIFSLIVLIQNQYEFKYLLPTILAGLFAAVTAGMAILILKRFMQIDYYNNSVLQLQKSLAKLKSIIYKYRKVEMLLAICIACCVSPILFKMIHNVDLYTNFVSESWRFVLGFLIAIPLCFLINKHLYDKKIENAENFFAELERFESKDV